MNLVTKSASRRAATQVPINHADEVWHECPRTGKVFKVERIFQHESLWAANPASDDRDWASVQIGQNVLATRTVFP